MTNENCSVNPVKEDSLNYTQQSEGYSYNKTGFTTTASPIYRDLSGILLPLTVVDHLGSILSLFKHCINNNYVDFCSVG